MRPASLWGRWHDLGMDYVRIYCDDQNNARIEDLSLSLAPKIFAPPAPTVDVSDPVPASQFMVLRLEAGWTDPAHPAPARQFFMVLRGRLEVSAGGESRSLPVGAVLLTEDVSGLGHAARCDVETLLACVRV